MNDLVRTLRTMLDDVYTPVLYMHEEDDGPADVAIVDPDWLGRVWEAAVKGGYQDPSLTDEGREAGFMPHEHSEPEDRAE